MTSISLMLALPSGAPAGGRTCSRAGRSRTCRAGRRRSEEHTSELQSRELISYAVFCLKTKTSRRGRWDRRAAAVAVARRSLRVLVVPRRDFVARPSLFVDREADPRAVREADSLFPYATLVR